jgi:hypothetical protein
VLRGAELVRVAEDIGGKLSFHDCTLLLTRRGRAPYLVGCVAQIVAARRVVRMGEKGSFVDFSPRIFVLPELGLRVAAFCFRRVMLSTL